jgi:predicted MPP superfamily phosphohydrolase
LHARQRLGIEGDRESRVFGQGLNFFHPENWYSLPSIINASMMLSGLYWRGRRNAERVELRRNRIASALLPQAFDGFSILHLSDLHVELSGAALARAIELLASLDYDLCVLTGDFRAGTAGPFDATLAGLARLRAHLSAPVYAVLGNHDTVLMVPGMEELGIRVLLNEHEIIRRGGERIHLAGVDDAHYFRVDNIEKTAAEIPEGEFSILLSHTPEIYRQAAHAGFNLMLSGHTHGGQICLPGSIPIMLDAKLPRRMGAGAWRFNRLAGYTSVGTGSCIVTARFNCPPEITLHRLERAR